MKKLLLVLCSILVLGAAGAEAQDSKITGYGALYGTYINYSGSDIKDYGYSLTGYLSIGDGKVHNLQLGIMHTHIKYKNGYSDLDQQDFTAVYSNTNGILRNHTFTFGVHYINSDDDLTDGGYTFFFDGTYFKYQTRYPYLFNWSGGVGIYFSSYDNIVNFHVFQINPHTSFRLYSSQAFGGLYTDITGYYIHVTDSDEVDVNNDNYYSIDVALRYYYGSYEFKIGGWIGKQVFAVKNGGFVVYNLNEEYKGGLYGEVSCSLSKHFRVLLDVGYNRYSEGFTGDDVDQTIGTISIGYRF